MTAPTPAQPTNDRCPHGAHMLNGCKECGRYSVPAQPPEGTPLFAGTDEELCAFLMALQWPMHGMPWHKVMPIDKAAKDAARRLLALRQSVAEIDAMFKAATWFTPEGLWTVYPLAERVRMAIAVCKECEDEDAAALKLPELRQSVERLERERQGLREQLQLALKDVEELSAEGEQERARHKDVEAALIDQRDFWSADAMATGQKYAELERENLELRHDIARHVEIASKSVNQKSTDQERNNEL